MVVLKASNHSFVINLSFRRPLFTGETVFLNSVQNLTSFFKYR